jgi:hypothetical protein
VVHVDRVRRLLDLQGSHAVERALLDGEIVAYEPHQTEPPASTALLFGLEGILEPDRAERLRWRAQRMLDLGVVLLKGECRFVRG